MKPTLVNCLLAAGLLVLATPNLCADEEQDLIATLQSAAGIPQKCSACQRLRIIGTEKAVPALAALLDEERVSHAARYALEGMPYPEAIAALRNALGVTTGPLKAGLIDSLGWRRDPAAVPLLEPLLRGSDTMLAAAAASALGRIGGPAALAALLTARDRGPAAVQAAVRDGLLQNGEHLVAEGKAAEATALYQKLVVPTESEQVRAAAYAGLIRASGPHALPLVAAALEGNDPMSQTAVLQLASDLPDPATTALLTNALPKASPALQLGVLGALQQRGDPAATPAVLAALRRPQPEVRAAAAAALGTLGDASAVAVLAEAATSAEEVEQRAARRALTVLRRGDVAGTLVSQLATAAPAVRNELVRALTARAEPSAVPALLDLARSGTGATRDAALQALGSLADSRHLDALVQLLALAPNNAARDGVRAVLAAVVERLSGRGALDVSPIVRGLTSGDRETRQALLPVSALVADARVRSAMRTALQDPDESIRRAAARALGHAQDAELLPDLLELARTTPEADLRALALEGYARLVGDATKVPGSAEKRAELLAPAFALAARPEEKRFMLSALANVPHRVALSLAEQACADTAVRAEAEVACLQIAKGLAASDFTAAETSLLRLATNAGAGSVRTNAQVLLKQLNSGWLCAGPYRQPGKQCQELFDIPFAPEQSETGAIDWRRAPGSADLGRAGEVELGGIVGGDHCVVYLKTRVYLPAAQEVTLAIGSDDGIKLWVNGELVHANNAVRGLTPGQDRAKGRLRQGWNELLAKITQHTAGCGMTVVVSAADGSRVDGLRFDPRGGTPP